MNFLTQGDPGLGKSQMLTAAIKVAPRGVYVCGNTTTTSGLTVTMSKDPETGDNGLEAGALVLADQGVCGIDEFDKMTEYQALLEVMEQQSISIAKAGMICSLPARTSILAAANPVGGHYNKSKTVAENLRMNSALLSRFDLIFILLDKPDQQKDQFLSEHIMKMHSGRPMRANDECRTSSWMSAPPSVHDNRNEDLTFLDSLKLNHGQQFDPVPPSLLKKYIAYAKKYVHPRYNSITH
jgi:DNA helicase MCM8